MYVFDNAVTAYSVEKDQSGSGKPPVPPCVKQVWHHWYSIIVQLIVRSHRLAAARCC